ncbi:MAG: hypothetical protein ACREAI_01340, partial [Nitrososphaera sp.]
MSNRFSCILLSIRDLRVFRICLRSHSLRKQTLAPVYKLPRRNVTENKEPGKFALLHGTLYARIIVNMKQTSPYYQ